MRGGRLIAVFGLPGDRRDVDIRESARIVGTTFDRVLIREDRNLRGREPGEVAAIIAETLRVEGLEGDAVREVLDEEHALRLAIENAEPGDLIVDFIDEPEPSRRIVEELRGTARNRQDSIASAYAAG
jgi:cyanophycin synthetase